MSSDPARPRLPRALRARRRIFAVAWLAPPPAGSCVRLAAAPTPARPPTDRTRGHVPTPTTTELHSTPTPQPTPNARAGAHAPDSSYRETLCENGRPSACIIASRVCLASLPLHVGFPPRMPERGVGLFLGATPRSSHLPLFLGTACHPLPLNDGVDAPCAPPGPAARAPCERRLRAPVRAEGAARVPSPRSTACLGLSAPAPERPASHQPWRSGHRGDVAPCAHACATMRVLHTPRAGGVRSTRAETPGARFIVGVERRALGLPSPLPLPRPPPTRSPPASSPAPLSRSHRAVRRLGVRTDAAGIERQRSSDSQLSAGRR